MGLESLGRAKAKRARIEAATERRFEKGDENVAIDTLEAIFKDERKSALFGRLLKARISGQENGFYEDFLRKQATGEAPTAKELDFLNTERIEFAHMLERAARAKELFGTEQLEYFSDRHEKFDMFAGQLRPERAVQLLHTQLDMMAIEDPRGLDELVEKFKRIEALKQSKDYVQLDKKVSAVLEKYGIDEHAALDALAHKKVAERENAFHEIVKQRYGRFWKAVDWLSGLRLGLQLPSISVQNIRGGQTDPDAHSLRRGMQWIRGLSADIELHGPSLRPRMGRTLSKRAAQRIYKKLDKAQKAKIVKDIDAHIAGVGELLAGATVGDDAFMRAVLTEAMGGTKADVQTMEKPASFAAVQEGKEQLTEERIAAGWKQRRDALSRTLHNGRDWRSLATAAERDRVKDAYLDELEQGRRAEGKGFFAQILAAFFRYLIAKARKEKDRLLPDDTHIARRHRGRGAHVQP